MYSSNRKGKTKGGIITKKECLNCKCSFIVQEKGEKFCDSVCESDYYIKKYNKQFNPEQDYHSSFLWKKIRWLVLLRDNFKCQYCGRKPSKDDVALEIDHIKPVKHKGLMIMENLITSCNLCNRGKNSQVYTKRILSAFKDKDFGHIDQHIDEKEGDFI